jgi:rhodanese-related sulfurtransferase
MSKKLSLPFALLILLSMILGACAAPAAPVVEATEAPQVEVTQAPVAEPTDAPAPEPTAEPTPVPLDFAALYTEAVSMMPADKSYSQVRADALSEELADGKLFLIDLREPAEIEKDGHIAGAVSIPVRQIISSLDKLPGQDAAIVVYCASGYRGGLVVPALKLLGYENVRSLAGGLGAWTKAGLPVETGMAAEPTAGTAPAVENQALLAAFDAYFQSLPDDFWLVKADALNEALGSAQPPVLVDIRTPEEWNKDGYIEGAINIPLAEFFASLDKLPAKDQPIVIYCGSGYRGGVVLPALQMLGYTNVRNLGGGLGAWKNAKLPVVGYVDWNAAWAEYLANLPEGYNTIKAADLNTALAESAPFVLDIREAAEVAEGFIPGAVHIPVREVLKNLDKLPAQDQPIVLYCGSGHRGGMLMAALQALGYTNVKNLGGGIGAWKKAELPVETGTPVAPVAGAAPEVDATRLRDLEAFFAALPEGFSAVKAPDLNTELASGTAPTIIDLRTEGEIAEGGMIEGAVPIKINDLLADPALLPAKDAPVVLVCQSGHRGGIGLIVLRMLGWTDVRNLNGGMNAWVAAELPVVK